MRAPSIHLLRVTWILSSVVLRSATRCMSELESILTRSKFVTLIHSPVFPVEKKEYLLKKVTEKYGDRVEIVKIEGLLADFML